MNSKPNSGTSHAKNRMTFAVADDSLVDETISERGNRTVRFAGQLHQQKEELRKKRSLSAPLFPDLGLSQSWVND